MAQRIASRAPRSMTRTLSPVALWTARVILWLGLILGVPASVVPATINWIRMGQRKKAFTVLLAIDGGFLLFVAYSPPGMGWIALIANVGAITYLHLQMRKDVVDYKQQHPVTNARWIIACLLGLGAWLVLLVAAAALSVALTLLRASPS